MNLEYVMLAGVLLTSTLLFLAIFHRLFYKDQKMKERVQQYIFEEQPEQPPEKDEKVKMAVEFRMTKERIRKRLQKQDKGQKIEMELHQAGIPIKPEEYVMFKWISIAFFAGLFYLIFDHFLLLFIGAIFGMMIPRFVVARKKKQRINQFNDHLAEMISSIVSALRAGFSFPQAMQNVRNESPSPVKEELEQLLKEMQYGATVEESLNRMKERVPSDDLDLMIQAIVIQRQVGGNLAVVLEKIVHTIRERIKIQGQIKTLTAQGKMSGVVVGLLPFGLAGMLYVMNPEYMGVLFTHPVGVVLIIIASISMVIGFIFIQKITSIEV
ncbi:type II secretion system F family protein [Tenuibacillus multivorans]|uniref:Tight adherence protein B n=1 Tax=Tenuibacillus multivorans TaxID=237069 RepID=A0A1G9WPV0_9BACI|nr:type II secretion system F family protein [Tenuibacillus multivorans]GEL77981.1 secretion system protein [Tenuibacillus multivorans]SDM86427.1 tight adherence protein B [Tenuibacillus multivorans]